MKLIKSLTVLVVGPIFHVSDLDLMFVKATTK